MRLSHFFIARPIFAAAVSVIITLIGLVAYFTLPVEALSMYLNDSGENGPPCAPDATMSVPGVICSAGWMKTHAAPPPKLS